MLQTGLAQNINAHLLIHDATHIYAGRATMYTSRGNVSIQFEENKVSNLKQFCHYCKLDAKCITSPEPIHSISVAPIFFFALNLKSNSDKTK